MPAAASLFERPAAIRVDLGAIFVSMELSRSKWLITSLSPGGGEKMSKHMVAGGDLAGLLNLFAALQAKTRARTGHSYRTVVIQEAGLDGFWIHRALEKEGIESHVVDPASIATSRRKKRAKTDRIDGEALVRALLAYKRGEPRVCSMVRPPSPEEEDRRRLVRERKSLITERIRHSNRIKGLLFAQGISTYEPLRRDRRARLAALRTGDGRELPAHLRAQISRELDRLELLLEQIKTVEAERDALLAEQQVDAKAPAGLLLKLKGIGPEFAAILWSEGLFRHYDNRRQLAAYAGLAPTPWQSGDIDREQGVSKAGNPRLRVALIQLSWLWLQHQSKSALARWFEARVARNGGRLRKSTIVALARSCSLRCGSTSMPAWKSKAPSLPAERATPHLSHATPYPSVGSHRTCRIQATNRRTPLAATPIARMVSSPELRPPQAGYWCSRHERRPDVRWIGRPCRPRHATSSDLGSSTNKGSSMLK